jgi:hypothetical protein
MPRRAWIFGAIAALALGASAALDIASPPAFTPDDAGLAILAGAFRPVLADVLWARLQTLEEEGSYEDMIPIAELLLAIDPQFEAAWKETAWTLGVDIPAFEDDPGIRWTWRRQGLALLEDGIRRNPGWFLRFWEGVYVRYQIASEPALAERFRADRTLDPEGLDPADFALRRYREAGAIEGHAGYVDRELEKFRSAPALAPGAGK